MFSFLHKPKTPSVSQLDKLPGVAASPDSSVGTSTFAQAENWLKRLEWTVIKRLDGQLQGDYRSLFRGVGLVLADLREYQSHDDVRHIDWNVTARMQTPYVREHQEDREVAAWFVVDLSGSVDFGSGPTTKRQLACDTVLVLSKMLAQHGNRVGVMLFTGHAYAQSVLPARSGRRHLLHMAHHLLNAGQNPLPGPRNTLLSQWLAQAHSLVRRRSVVFVVSDFISAPGWEKNLSMLARRHEVVAVRLHDPLELSWPDSGMVLMQDAESGEQLLVDGNDTGFRQRFAALAQERETALRDSLAHAGVDCLELRTDEALDQALLRFAQLRKRASQLNTGGGPQAHRAAQAFASGRSVHA